MIKRKFSHKINFLRIFRIFINDALASFGIFVTKRFHKVTQNDRKKLNSNNFDFINFYFDILISYLSSQIFYLTMNSFYSIFTLIILVQKILFFPWLLTFQVFFLSLFLRSVPFHDSCTRVMMGTGDVKTRKIRVR